MDRPDEWLRGLRSWADGNDSIQELWLFGSRAAGGSRPESDVDLAVSLMPAIGTHNWALRNYIADHSTWKWQLESIVGRHVSLEALEPGSPQDAHVRRTGKLLWARSKEE